MHKHQFSYPLVRVPSLRIFITVILPGQGDCSVIDSSVEIFVLEIGFEMLSFCSEEITSYFSLYLGLFDDARFQNSQVLVNFLRSKCS